MNKNSPKSLRRRASEARVKARQAGRRASAMAHQTASGLVWLLIIVTAIVVVGVTLLVSEGARTLIGHESVGQKIDRGIARANGVLADAGESVRDRVVSTQERIENTGKRLDDRRVAVLDAGAARVDAATDAVRGRVDEIGSQVSDTSITASIKADLLKDPYLSAFRVEVDTQGGEVTLRGEAASEASRQRAERMAAGVAGVKRVTNQIAVRAG